MSACGLVIVALAAMVAAASTQLVLPTPCQLERLKQAHRVGGWVPICDQHGDYKREQCIASTGYCWTVDPRTGAKIADATNTICQQQRSNAIRRPGSFLPQCEPNGDFSARQCHGSTGVCWCVGPKTGLEIPNTSGRFGEVNCPASSVVLAPRDLRTPCLIERSKSHPPGSYVPQCDAYGNYAPKQCNGSTGFCWCVDVRSGRQVGNTSARIGEALNCGGTSQASTTRRPIRTTRRWFIH